MAFNERILEIVLKARDEASDEIQKVGKTAGGVANLLAGSFKNAAIVSGAALAGITVEAFRAIDAFQESQATLAQLDAVLKSTAGVAGVTRDEVINLASSLEQISTFSDEAVIGAENMLLTFTSIGKEVFPQATKTVLDMSTALGQDLKNSSIQLGKALNDPITGVTALRRVGVQFNDAQQEQIKTLVESGKLLDAQKLILKELQVEFGGSAEAAGKTFGGQLTILKNTINNIEESIGELLTNALKPFIGSLTLLASDIQKVIEGTITLDEFVERLRTQFGVFGDILGRLINFFAHNRDALIALAGAIIGFLLVAIVAATAAMLAFIGLSAPVIGIALAIGAVGALVIAHWSDVQGFFTNLWTNIVEKFTTAKTFIETILTSLRDTVLHIIQAIVTYFTDQFNLFSSVVSYVFNFVWTIVQYYLALTRAEIEIALAIIDTIWKTIWGAIGPYMMQIWEGIKTAVSTGINFVKGVIEAGLTWIRTQWENSWKSKYDATVSWFNKIIGFISEGVEKVKNFFRDMARGIENIIKNIHIPTIHLDIEEKDFLGHKIKVPKIGWYEQGGFVPNNMLAYLHKGEFVLSKDMLAGNAASPITNNAFNTPIQIGPVYVNDQADIDSLSQRLAFAFHTAGSI